MPTDKRTAHIQRVIGWVCILVALFIAYQSLDPALELTWPAVFLILAIIFVTMRKLEELTAIIKAYNKKD